MRRMVAGCLVAAALALGALVGMIPSGAEAAITAPLSVVHEPSSLVQTVQYYGYRGYYGRPRFYGHRRFYGYRRFYGRGPGFYGRRGYYR